MDKGCFAKYRDVLQTKVITIYYITFTHIKIKQWMINQMMGLHFTDFQTDYCYLLKINQYYDIEKIYFMISKIA